MTGKLFIMGGLAVAFGATSYVAGNSYLDSQTQARLNQLETSKPIERSVRTTKVITAKQRLKFGEILTSEKLTMIEWPTDAIPAGSFSDATKLLADGTRRAISPIEEGELILAVKVTGDNARAGLAGVIAEGKRAVTIPVNAVDGVGGFVQPGDLVDLILTTEDRETGEQSADIIMEAVKVLSVDQQVGERSETASIAQSVTLETTARGAKKITLGRNAGQISLLLRGTAEEIASGNVEPDSGSEDGSLFSFEQEKKTKSVRVVTDGQATDFTVPVENKNKIKVQ